MSRFFFVIQMIPLCNTIKAARPVYVIQLPSRITLPAASFFADGSLLLAGNSSTAARLYKTVKSYWHGSGAMLRPGNCVVIPVKPTNTQELPRQGYIQLNRRQWYWAYPGTTTYPASKTYKRSSGVCWNVVSNGQTKHVGFKGEQLRPHISSWKHYGTCWVCYHYTRTN